MKNMETEFKWEANTPRAFVKALGAVRSAAGKANVSQPRRLAIKDVYLDAADGALQAAQIAFRVRNTDGHWEATFKTRSEVVGGKAVRREETLAMPGVKNLSGAMAFLENKKTWKGLNLRGLKPLFCIANSRLAYEVSCGKNVCELALDDCKITVLGRIVLMKEVELELKRGNEDFLQRLAQDITRMSGLVYARVSKVKTASALLRLWGDK